MNLAFSSALVAVSALACASVWGAEESTPSPAPSASPVATASPQPEASPSPAVELPSEAEIQKKRDLELQDLTLDQNGVVNLSLADSIRIAVQNATSVLKAEHAEVVSGSALLQSYGQFLPNLSATGNVDYQTGRQYYTIGTPALVRGSSLNSTATVAADLNLFNGLADFSGLKSSLLKKDAATLTALRAKQAVALDISQSFLQVILDFQLVDIARKNLQESQERERLLTEQTRLGVRNLSDLFRQQAQTSADESLLLTSENKARTDQIALLKKLRVDVAKSYHFVDPKVVEGAADSRFLDENALLKIALSNRADLKAGDETSDATRWDVKGAWSGYLPKLDLIGNATPVSHYLYSDILNGNNVLPATQNNMGYQLTTQVEYSVGVYLTWSIFDRFVTHENVSKARALADDAEVDAADLRNLVEGDVREAYGNYATSISQLRASKKGLQAAQKAYEVIEGRYEVGSASFIDLITAQATLLQAESARAQTLIDFVLQGKNVEFATGEIRID